MCEVETDLYPEAMCLFVSAPQVSCFLGLFIRFRLEEDQPVILTLICYRLCRDIADTS